MRAYGEDGDVNIDNAKELKRILAKEIYDLCTSYESATGLVIENISVEQVTGVGTISKSLRNY